MGWSGCPAEGQPEAFRVVLVFWKGWLICSLAGLRVESSKNSARRPEAGSVLILVGVPGRRTLRSRSHGGHGAQTLALQVAWGPWQP